MSLRVTLQGGPELRRRMQALGKAPKEMLGNIGIRAVGEAKLRVPRRTGNLARTIRIGTVTEQYVEVHAGGTVAAGYAATVEFGSRAHIIVPRRRKALAWGGHRTLSGRLGAGMKPAFFAKRVRHPGTTARAYLRPGLVAALEQVGLSDVVRLWNEAA